MAEVLLTKLLPVLSGSLGHGFNVFDVMHHGTHEKQLSNVFAWLLERGGSHGLEDTFQRIFIDEVNRGLGGREQFAVDGAYRVRQEVDTSRGADIADIADIVLESDTAVLVIENYFTSDGHGHSYSGYLKFGLRHHRQAAVVLLCGEEDRMLLTDGWEGAAVVTYETLIERVRDAIEGDREYKLRFPEPYSFIVQMHRKFGKGGSAVGEREALDFLIAMCDTGEAKRYGVLKVDVAAEQFATDVAEQAREQFYEARALLQKVKDRLRTFSARVLAGQIAQSVAPDVVQEVKVHWSGIYRWSVIFHLSATDASPSQEYVALLFGPTAQNGWTVKNPGVPADFSRVFIEGKLFRGGEMIVGLRPSSVTMQEVLDGLEPNDTRLRDEISQLIAVGIDMQ